MKNDRHLHKKVGNYWSNYCHSENLQTNTHKGESCVFMGFGVMELSVIIKTLKTPRCLFPARSLNNSYVSLHTD